MKIGVHAGAFHADEATSCYLLRRTREYADAEVVRTLDPAVLEQCNIVCDVGGEYAHERRIYDHHQRGFNEYYSEEFSDIKMCSCGLIWRHYGTELIEHYAQRYGVSLSDGEKAIIHRKVYISFFLAIDAGDNGISATAEEPRYVDRTTLSARIDRLNPQWYEEVTEEMRMERFNEASEMCGKDFELSIKIAIVSWLPARKIVYDAMKARYEYDEQGRILFLGRYCPFYSHLNDYEATFENSSKTVLFVVFYNTTRNEWNARAAAASRGSFRLRFPFPEEWRSLRDEELCKVVGIEGCVFCHSSGFLIVNHTQEGVLAMCKKALLSHGK